MDNEASEAERLTAAIDAGIPAHAVKEVAGLLQGDTPEELQAHATEIKGLFGTTTVRPKFQPAIDPSQGSGGGRPPKSGSGDPLLDAMLRAVERR